MSEEEAIKELNEIKELVEDDLKYKDHEVTAILDQIDLESLVIVLNLIEKQQKEIEELKAINKMQEYRINEMDIPKSVAEQKEKQAYIDGTNIADKLCNKKWKDKIKAILEEYKYTEIGDSEKIIEFYKKMQSLLEKE